MIDKRTFLDQSGNNKEGSYDKIQKIKNGRGENYVTGFLLDYHYFKNYYEITIKELVNNTHLTWIQKRSSKIFLLEI